MAEESGPSPFDVRTVRDLVGLMSRHDLAELELADGTRSIKLKRAIAAPMPILTATPVAMTPVAHAAPVAAAPVAAAAIEPVKPARQLLEIKSPTPGTFYSSPKPTDPPFVQVGSKVGPGTIVCIIEAMKIFNEIPADLTGTIVEVCVESKQPVEYGQVLFRIDPAA